MVAQDGLTGGNVTGGVARTVKIPSHDLKYDVEVASQLFQKR